MSSHTPESQSLNLIRMVGWEMNNPFVVFFLSPNFTFHYSWQVLSMHCFPNILSFVQTMQHKEGMWDIHYNFGNKCQMDHWLLQAFFWGGSCIYMLVWRLSLCFIFVLFLLLLGPTCVVLSLLLLLWWFLESKGSIPSKMATTRLFVPGLAFQQTLLLLYLVDV